MTPLHSTLKRALTIDGRDYVLTLTETALKLTLKGKRNGVELPWLQLVNGEAALELSQPKAAPSPPKRSRRTAAAPTASRLAAKPKRKTRRAHKK